jgi:hypothetical protein
MKPFSQNATRFLAVGTTCLFLVGCDQDAPGGETTLLVSTPLSYVGTQSNSDEVSIMSTQPTDGLPTIEPESIESALTGPAAMALLNISGVIGVGAGVCEAETVNASSTDNCILIYLSDTAATEVLNQLPASIEGFPVIISAGGPLSIDAL